MGGGEGAALERARQGDEEAFRVIVDAHSRPLFRLAYRMTANQQDAEDIVQETFLRAYRAVERFDPRAAVSTWLYAIASNCAIDTLRRRKHRQTEELDRPEYPEPAGAEPGPERHAAGRELRARIDLELGRLTAKERVAFSLRHFENVPIREIARVMGAAEGSVKNYIFRAVRKLRRALEGATEVRR
jgi:RNA polymerase sigma-70 factor (ECF subfamily)